MFKEVFENLIEEDKQLEAYIEEAFNRSEAIQEAVDIG